MNKHYTLQEYIEKFSSIQDSYDYYFEQQKEIERLNNIINELEKYIGAEWYCFDNESIEFEVAKDILDKLQKLKGSDKSEK